MGELNICFVSLFFFFLPPGASPYQDAPSARRRATAALHARYCVPVSLLKCVQCVLSDAVCWSALSLAETSVVCPQDGVQVSAKPPAQNSHWLSPSVRQNHLCFGTPPTLKHWGWCKHKRTVIHLLRMLCCVCVALLKILLCVLYNILVFSPSKRIKEP